MKSVFYVNNITLSVINHKYNIFMPAHCVYFTNSPIFLTLFLSAFTNKETIFSFASISFFDKDFFFQFWCVLFRFNLTFVSFGYLFLDLLQLPFAKGTRNFKYISKKIRREISEHGLYLTALTFLFCFTLQINAVEVFI